MSDKQVKELEELIKVSQRVIRRQQREIQILREFIDSINTEHYITWDEFVEGKRKEPLY